MAAVIEGDCRVNFAGATLASGAQTRILGPLNLGRYDKKAFTIYNLGPFTLSGAIIRSNPDQKGYDLTQGGSLADPTGVPAGPNAGLWENHTVFTANIASGQVITVQIKDDSRKWFDLVALNREATSLTVSGWCHARTV